jgi:lipid A oxidase
MIAPAFATADVQLSFYGGAQTAPASDISIRDPLIGAEDFSQDWEGRSFEAPIYYGVRATRWRSPTFGYGLDFAITKSILPMGWVRRDTKCSNLPMV